MSLTAIRKALRDVADKNAIAVLQRFFKTGPGEYGEGDRFIGVRVPQIRKLAKEFKLAELSDIEALLQSPIHEERMLALILMSNQYKKAEAAMQKKIYTLYLKNTKFINNWDLVDTSAPHIVGAYLADRDRAKLYTLAKSKDLWKKRIAILSTFYFIRQHDFKDALNISEILLQDEHDLIHKAVGWMLREIGGRDFATEEKFLKKHYKKMPRTMLRYAIEKFPEKKRKMYLLK